jgi:hypothetical protein
MELANKLMTMGMSQRQFGKMVKGFKSSQLMGRLFKLLDFSKKYAGNIL